MSREVQQHIKKREKAEHAPKAQRPDGTREVAQRRHAERDHQKIQGPAAAAVQQRGDRIGAERDAQYPERAGRQTHRRQ